MRFGGREGDVSRMIEGEEWMSLDRARSLAVATRAARGGWRAEERIGWRKVGEKGGRWRDVRAVEIWARVGLLIVREGNEWLWHCGCLKVAPRTLRN